MQKKLKEEVNTLKTMQNNIQEEEKYDYGDMLVRDAVIQLKDGNTAYAYKKEQVDYIVKVMKEKYNIELKIKKEDFYWSLKTTY